MKKGLVWAILLLAVAASSAVLYYVASIRFPIHPVISFPPEPVRDYDLQALIAYIGIAAVWVVGVITAIVTWRSQTRQRRLVARGCVAVALIAATAAVCALTIPAS